MITVFAVQSVVIIFVFKIQSILTVQKSISATYHLNDAFKSNSRKFDYVTSKSNVRYRSTRKSQKSIRNDRIISIQNAKRQKNYVKNFQQKYQKFYDDYNHSLTTYEMQNQLKYNDYYFQTKQSRFFFKIKKKIVSIQSNYNDYYQQSVQFCLSLKSKKKNVLYSFKKKSTFIIFWKKIAV